MPGIRLPSSGQSCVFPRHAHSRPSFRRLFTVFFHVVPRRKPTRADPPAPAVFLADGLPAILPEFLPRSAVRLLFQARRLKRRQ